MKLDDMRVYYGSDDLRRENLCADLFEPLAQGRHVQAGKMDARAPASPGFRGNFSENPKAGSLK